MQVAATFVSLTQLRVMVPHAASPQTVAVASYNPNPYPTPTRNPTPHP